MFANISSGQLCGFLFLFILLTSALSQVLGGAALNTEDIPGTLRMVAAIGEKFRLSVVIDLISHVSIIALAALLFITFSPYNRSLALVGTLWRVAEGTILALNEVNKLVILDVSLKYASAMGVQARRSNGLSRLG